MHQLLITIICTHRQSILPAICALIQDSECGLRRIHCFCISDPFTILNLNISGKWNQLALFEANFSLLQTHHRFFSLVQQITPQTEEPQEALPYQAYIVGKNYSNTLNRIVQFFVTLSVIIYDIATQVYQTIITKIEMIEINITFLIPTAQSISILREQILQFCDEQNLEIILEQKRH